MDITFPFTFITFILICLMAIVIVSVVIVLLYKICSKGDINVKYVVFTRNLILIFIFLSILLITFSLYLQDSINAPIWNYK